MMQKFIEKAAVLIEALPYIQDFRGAVVVVKLGGSAHRNQPAFTLYFDTLKKELNAALANQ